jgi:hypothetical protein
MITKERIPNEVCGSTRWGTSANGGLEYWINGFEMIAVERAPNEVNGSARRGTRANKSVCQRCFLPKHTTQHPVYHQN